MSTNDANILICCTGSVATIKLPLLISSLQEAMSNKDGTFRIQIKVVMTKSALHFCSKDEITNVCVYDDDNEWEMWKTRGDPVLHIELAKWADLLLIAPLDANTLAKMAVGLCDNLLTCIVRAWEMHKPLLFCPAMNTKMWHHPITNTHISTLKSWGYKEIECISKTLMCGDTGLGAMAEVKTICSVVMRELSKL